jgi:hypothetical protein
VAEQNKVVVRFLNGKLLKGTTQDFFPKRPLFHVLPLGGGAASEVLTRELKAVFFVKDYEGNPQRKDLRGFVSGPHETAQGKKIAVRFRDGELMCGYSLSYAPDRSGFFMFPADEGSNNERVFVVTGSCAEVKSGPAADDLVNKLLRDDEKAA